MKTGTIKFTKKQTKPTYPWLSGPAERLVEHGWEFTPHWLRQNPTHTEELRIRVDALAHYNVNKRGNHDKRDPWTRADGQVCMMLKSPDWWKEHSLAKLKLMDCANFAGWKTTPGFCLIRSGAIGRRDDCRDAPRGRPTVTAPAGRPRGPPLRLAIRPLFCALMSIVICGHSRRISLVLHANFSGHCKFIVFSMSRLVECTPRMRHKNKGQFSRGNDVQTIAPCLQPRIQAIGGSIAR
jgi:hypothetical protein